MESAGSYSVSIAQRWLEQAAKEEADRDGGSKSAILADYQRRLDAGEPLQYVLGSWQFRWLELRVDGRALIPRPETELIVDLIMTELGDNRSGKVLELGTGSGAIAASLAFECPDLLVVATDSSADALALAEMNLVNHGLDDRVTLRLGDWWEAVDSDERFRLICSNPPYIAEDEWLRLDAVVRDWEPPGALVAGRTGLECYQVIFGQAHRYLEEGHGVVVVEIGAAQGSDVQHIAVVAGFDDVSVRQDLVGRDRFVVARG
jgi:release factor glutamine methyltransferase